jgi:protein-L-isoaspartate O-methyltransferase
MMDPIKTMKMAWDQLVRSGPVSARNETIAQKSGAERSDNAEKGSLAYRKNKEAIRHGTIPTKYMRLLDVIPGDRVLELGAAEGVLSLLLAERKRKVYAVERNRERHEEAVRLQELWRAQGRDVSRCEMIMGDLREHFDLLQKVDTLVAIRSIYYLRDQIADLFSEVGKHVRYVVLCGNKNRAQRYFETNGQPDDNLGPFNFYASIDGMRKVLEDSGYTIDKIVPEGDPIVIGIKTNVSARAPNS